jgi:dTDP-4-amino-4,6-dideoxygalactose transaminase
MIPLPLVDLSRQHAGLRHEIDEAIARVFASSQFILGAEVARFEEEFAQYCGSTHAIACGNGTDALELALWGAGVETGDEVILPANTFAATAEAIVRCGAVPRLVDVDSRTLLMEASQVELAVTPKTKAIIPVHLYGNCVDMEPVLQVAQNQGLQVIEDAAQAHGASLGGKRVGTFGVAGCFSFYPGKNLGACGDAGAVITDDPEVDERIRRARDHGRSSKYVHDFPGRNSRMDEIQAAILRIKLPHLDRWNSRRAAIAGHYREGLAGADVHLITALPACNHVYHLFVVTSEARDKLGVRLRARGVTTGVHYPIPLHKQAAFSAFGLSALPICEHAAEQVLSLPIFPEMTDEEVDLVVAATRDALHDGGKIQ